MVSACGEEGGQFLWSKWFQACALVACLDCKIIGVSDS